MNRHTHTNTLTIRPQQLILTCSVWILLLLMGGKTTLAQHLSLDWGRRLTADWAVTGKAIVLDPGKNIYLTGTFMGTADFDPGTGTARITSNNTPSSFPSSDIFLAKYNETGSYIWSKQIGGINEDAVSAIRHVPSGHLYLAGTFKDSADFDPSATQAFRRSNGNTDFFIGKYDTAGNYVWAISIGGTGEEQVYDLITDASGDLYVTGTFHGTVDFDPGTGVETLTATTYINAFVAKYSAAGSLIWAKAVNGKGNTEGRALAVDAADNLYIAGGFYDSVYINPGSVADNAGSAGRKDIFLTKWDRNGAFIWAKTIGGVTDETAEAIAFTPDGMHLHITGQVHGSNPAADFDPGSGTAVVDTAGMYIARYDTSGSLIWVRAIHGHDNGGTATVQELAISGFGDIYVTGFLMQSVDFDPSPAATAFVAATGYSKDIFLAKYDSSGNYLWAGKMGGTASDEGKGIVLDHTGGVLLTGIFNGTADFDPGPNELLMQGPGESLFFIKLDDGCPILNTVTTTACDSFMFGGNKITASGIYVHSFSSSGDCDSIVTLHLTINHSAANPVVSGTYCDSVVFNGVSYNTTGIYTQTFYTALGCDSSVTYDLVIKGRTSEEMIDVTSCGIYRIGDREFTASGIYLITLENTSGCDSLLTLNLTVVPVPEAEIIRSGNTLTATAGAQYQWINCADGSIIAGANGQHFIPAHPGSYAVVLTTEDCTDTSSCVQTSGTGIESMQPDRRLVLYPNPAVNTVILKTNILAGQATVRVLALTGQVLFVREQQHGDRLSLDLSPLAPGIYYIEVEDGIHTMREKVWKQ